MYRGVFLIVCFLFTAFVDALLLSSALGQRQCIRSSSTTIPKRATWMDRFNELQEYHTRHGNTLVPKRYAENPTLGNWVNKQRQLYRKYCANESRCILTDERVQLLNGIDFCWDATELSPREQRHEISWWTRFQALRGYDLSQETGPLPLTLACFLRTQRKEFAHYVAGKPSQLDSKKVDALAALGEDWHISTRQRQWNLRYKELEEYRSTHGDCCVPITYDNNKLANWVSNVRKRYKARDFPSGKVPPLSKEQVDQLNAVGFVWDRWELLYDSSNYIN